MTINQFHIISGKFANFTSKLGNSMQCVDIVTNCHHWWFRARFTSPSQRESDGNFNDDRVAICRRSSDWGRTFEVFFSLSFIFVTYKRRLWLRLRLFRNRLMRVQVHVQCRKKRNLAFASLSKCIQCLIFYSRKIFLDDKKK